jgi:hypothetical protein
MHETRNTDSSFETYGPESQFGMMALLFLHDAMMHPAHVFHRALFHSHRRGGTRK